MTGQNWALPDGGHPPGGRCLAVCYCRKCPHFKPIARTSGAPARIKPTASTKRMAQSWADRDEPTWLDDK